MNNFFDFFQTFFRGVLNIFQGKVFRTPPEPPIENIEPDTINVDSLPTLDTDLRVIDTAPSGIVDPAFNFLRGRDRS